MKGQDVAGNGGGGLCKMSGCRSSEIKIKSSCEVGKLAMLFWGFDDTKRTLVRSTGFDGLLKTPLKDELDDHFSM
jgi:hypothetical protein